MPAGIFTAAGSPDRSAGRQSQKARQASHRRADQRELSEGRAAGGDMGAHVWFPAYLRDHLLGQFRVAGWAPDWFAGFPAGQFYFPLPALTVVFLDIAMPYNVAFKLVSVLGVVMMPAAAYAFGRGLRAPRPTPTLFSLATVLFLFFKGASGTGPNIQTIAFNQGIMGGTLRSTLAGEFSFSIAIALALVFLGAFASALNRRTRACGSKTSRQ